MVFMSLPISGVVDRGFTFFQNNVLNVTTDVSKRVAAIALIALSMMAALYIIFKCCFKGGALSKPDVPLTPYASFPLPSKSSTLFVPTPTALFTPQLIPFKQAIFQIQPNAEVIDLPLDELTSLTDEQDKVNAIKEKWLDDPKDELKRVLEAKLFPQSIQKAMSLSESFKINQIFSVLGRALEIKNLYRSTHYVFTHGQAPELSIANLLIEECVRVFTPKLSHPLNSPFRLPHTISYCENTDKFLNKYNIQETSSFTDNANNSEMLAVDAQFWNGESGESALHFFSSGTNINLRKGEPELIKIFKSIFHHYLPNEKICNLFALRGLELAKQIKSDTKLGSLYVICIPKEVIQDEKRNFAYHCHPFGKTCHCFNKTRIELLEEMQKDQFVRCKNTYMTQYRLLTSRLTEEKNVRTFALNALPKNKNEYHRDEVKKLIQEFSQCSYLLSLVEDLDEDPLKMIEIDSLLTEMPQLAEYAEYFFAEKK